MNIRNYVVGRGEDGMPRRSRKAALRSAAVVAVALAAIVPAVGASGAATGHTSGAKSLAVTNPKFVFIQTNGTQSYFVDEGKGATAEAKKLGASVTIENTSSSDATTVSDVQAAISAGDNGLIVVAPDATVGPRLVSLANAANVPISSTDNGFSGGSDNLAVPFVGINASAFGGNSGTQLATMYKASKWSSSQTYALLYVLPSLPTCNQRTNAEKAALITVGFPASHIINVSYDGTESVGLNNTGPVLTAHPQAKYWLAAGCNDDGVYGGAKALTSHGVSAKNIIAVGLGGDLACTIWAKGAPNVGFAGTNYIDPNAIGAAAVLNMDNFVTKATPFPSNTYVAPISITKSDFRKIDKSC